MENIGDLSKIIGVIMENPELIGKIRSLAQNTNEEKEEAEAVSAHTDNADASIDDGAKKDAKEASVLLKNEHIGEQKSEKRKHRELLCALKPYVSKERAKTIDTFVSVIEIVGLMKSVQ